MPAKKIIGLLMLLLGSAPAMADTVALNPKHPDRYVVTKGDTLWDISARFLRDPWRWPDVWGSNRQISNPHLIYPGDVISLTWRDGKPQLNVSRSDGPYTRLSPQARASSLETNPLAVPVIPRDAIQPFLDKSFIISELERTKAPYVVAIEEGRVIGGAGHDIFVRNTFQTDTDQFVVFQAGDAYASPAKPDEILGYQAIYAGKAQLTTKGDPATFRLTQTSREVLVGDRLLPDMPQSALSYSPKAPGSQINGYIISVPNGVSRISQYTTVIIDKGHKDGLEPGHVLAVDRSGDTVRDPIIEGPNKQVTLPDERAGLMMVYRTFERTSLALIMQAERDIRVNDKIRNP